MQDLIRDARFIKECQLGMGIDLVRVKINVRSPVVAGVSTTNQVFKPGRVLVNPRTYPGE